MTVECRGPCKRELAHTDDNFYRHCKGGLKGTCKMCQNANIAATQRKRLQSQPEERERTCPKCLTTKPLTEEFWYPAPRPSPVRPRFRKYCRPCESKLQADAVRKRDYGITSDDYLRMLAEQGGGCAICSWKPLPGATGNGRLHIDHCHRTGKLRQLLCIQCNNGLGRFREDTAVMRKAIEYIEKHR